MFDLLAENPLNTLPPSQMWGFIGLGVVLLIYVVVLRPMMRRKDPLERPPAFASLSQQRSVERQMQNLLVELSEMARQVSGQLDTRAAKLELLIKEADEKIAALRAAGNGQSGAASSSSVSAPVGAAEVPDPRHAEVYALSDQGHAPHDIAAQLGRPRGEIELILALRGKG